MFAAPTAILLVSVSIMAGPIILPKHSSKRLLVVRVVLSVLLLAAAIYVLTRNLITVQNSLEVARHASIPWLVVSLVLMACTFAIAAGVYGALALHPLRYGQTVLVEVATAFVNRLLPAGIGGLGLHGVYLYKRRHTAAEATVVVSMNNLLGMTAHLLILTGVIVARPAVLRLLLDREHTSVNGWLIAAVLLVVGGAVLAMPAVRVRIVGFAHNLWQSIRKLRFMHVLRAVLLAMLLTATYTLILLATTRSVGVHLGLLQIFIVFSIGMLTATATPTPGGLVGAEAGLFAGFVAYGVSSPLAGAVVLLYRLVTYWLPLVPGCFALLVARRRKLL
jgi:glycosyltransferase 2 family protein